MAKSRRRQASDGLSVLGVVNGEGGPLILADAVVMRSWRGVMESNDYDDLCRAMADAGSPDLFAGKIARKNAIAWQMHGGGTADVFAGGDTSVRVVRGWFDEATWEDATRRHASAATLDLRAGAPELRIASGVLAIFWAPESGIAITDADLERGAGCPSGELSMGETALLVRVRPGRYRVSNDHREDSSGDSVRCVVQRAR